MESLIRTFQCPKICFQTCQLEELLEKFLYWQIFWKFLFYHMSFTTVDLSSSDPPLVQIAPKVKSSVHGQTYGRRVWNESYKKSSYRGLICNWFHLQLVSFAIGVETHGIGIGFEFLMFFTLGGVTPQERKKADKQSQCQCQCQC